MASVGGALRLFDGIRFRFLLLLAVSILAFALSDLPVVGLVSLAGMAAAIYGLFYPGIVLMWRNHTFEQRVAHFSDLAALVTTSLVMVSGRLDSRFYADDRVIRALKSLPDEVKIIIYLEESPDPGSDAFLRELERRRASFRWIQRGKVWHGAVVDGLHCKIEKFDGANDAMNKRAVYYPFDQERARAALRTFARWEVRTEQAAA